jgi:hypothetical protein
MILWAFIGCIAYYTIMVKMSDDKIKEDKRNALREVFVTNLFHNGTGFLLTFILGPLFWATFVGYWLGRGLSAWFEANFLDEIF